MNAHGNPKTWLIYYVVRPNSPGKIDGLMVPALKVEHEGTQAEIFAKLPEAPDGRSVREAWYPCVLEDAPAASFPMLERAAELYLHRREWERSRT